MDTTTTSMESHHATIYEADPTHTANLRHSITNITETSTIHTMLLEPSTANENNTIDTVISMDCHSNGTKHNSTSNKYNKSVESRNSNNISTANNVNSNKTIGSNKAVDRIDTNSNTSTSNGSTSTCDSVEPYCDGALVWVRLGQSWWPGSVIALDRCPQDFLKDLKKTPLAVVKFFEENGYVDIHKTEYIYPYNCERKKEFIKKGISFHTRRIGQLGATSNKNFRSVQNKEELYKKFESDVLLAQKLTGGKLDVFSEIEEDLNKRRIDYSNLGFGPPKPKKKKEDSSHRRKGNDSDISEAVRYKKESNKDGSNKAAPQRQMKLEHKVVIMEQPHVENMKEDMNKACNSYTCYSCGFSCTRLGVIIWHNKGHIKTVMNYDTGIRIPGRRKRRSKTSKGKGKKAATASDHSKTNGHHTAEAATIVTVANSKTDEAKLLLMDWDDEDEQYDNDQQQNSEQQQQNDVKDVTTNGGDDSHMLSDDDGAGAAAYHRSLQDRVTRRPMRGAEALNSAFDALLADFGTPNSSVNNADDSVFTKNDSDSDDASDWEKYYTKDSDDERNCPENEQQLEEDEEEEEAKESDIKSLCEQENEVLDDIADDIKYIPSEDIADYSARSSVTNGVMTERVSMTKKREDFNDATDEEGDGIIFDGVADISNGGGVSQELRDEDNNSSSNSSSNISHPAVGDRSASSSPSSSGGPAFMLVAVDAHGNNVPMPALTDRHDKSNMVAVEASMEDGTSRTLYIDPAYLEPNVDLSNLMLHIDNSGQETVIIPTSSAGSATLAHEAPPHLARPPHGGAHVTTTSATSNTISSSSSDNSGSTDVDCKPSVSQHQQQQR